jgi:transposase
VHLAHPLGVKAFSYRRVKNDERDAADLADLLRMGRLPEAWIAPPATRELRELVRHRAKLVGLRSNLKCQVHAVLARVELTPAVRARVNSALRLIDSLDFEVEVFTTLANNRLRDDPGYRAIQQIHGVGPVLAAVFIAEIGDIGRFPGPTQWPAGPG